MRGIPPVISALVALLPCAGVAEVAPGSLTFSPWATTREECVLTAGGYGWVCDLLANREDYNKVYGEPFWQTASVKLSLSDLDADGLEDMVLMVQHVGDCGSAGCAYMFAFGGQPVPRAGSIYAVRSRYEPVLLSEHGEPGLVFGPSAGFWSVADLKSEAAISIGRWAKICATRSC